jgi:hypothetical protein
MKTRLVNFALSVALVGPMLSVCATKPYDYANYRAYPPRSILVLPPLNESTDVAGTYSYLSTVTYPVAEMGYYVFPVAVVDHFFKENGMPTAGEMHQAPLNKIREIIGADAVLYITLKQYGTKYEVITSITTVWAQAKLVDTKTGTLLWEGTVTAVESSSSGNILADLITAAVEQVVNKSMDHAHDVSRIANSQFAITDHGLLYGPYHPKYGTAK